ncbi:hypothetical protein EJB05_45286, partial [Eragrostis curvula]
DFGGATTDRYFSTTAEDDGTCDSVQRSSGRRSGSGGTKITGGGAAAPVSEAAITEAGGVLDPFSAFIPIELGGSGAGFVGSMAPLHWIRDL